MHAEFWSENLKRIDNSGHLSIDESIILRWIIRKKGVD
jgi:hypothetical protein